MKNCRILKSSAILIIISFSLHTSAQNILPTPMKMDIRKGTFKFNNAFTISCKNGLKDKAEYLIESINSITQLTGKIVDTTGIATINLSIEPLPDLGNEGYMLEITQNKIIIKGNDDAGIQYAIESLLQFVYEYKQFGSVVFPCVLIKDKPKYGWRSFLLDSGRQYHSLKFLKRYLNYMAMLKMNVFHWHLTENDGWRIEIKKYPLLTTIGSKVAKGAEQQGFYTQLEIKEIIRYAERLNIQVVPEIDLPGHSFAALSAYPEMTCFKKKPISVNGHSPYIFCGGREETYNFIKDILDEVCSLFPSQYIHLGGDEAPKDQWDKCPYCQALIKKERLKDSHELQQYFSKRLADYLKTKGKKVIFWEDVLMGDNKIKLPNNCIIEWWNFVPNKYLGLKKSLENGYHVIGATWDYNYLYLPITTWKGHVEKFWSFDIRQAYNKNPSDIKNPDSLMMGMEACMWGDYNSQEYMNDRRVFPRIFALAEEMWHVGNKIKFDVFYKKVKANYPKLKEMGIDYGPALKEEVPQNYQWGIEDFR